MPISLHLDNYPTEFENLNNFSLMVSFGFDYFRGRNGRNYFWFEFIKIGWSELIMMVKINYDSRN